MLAIDMFPPEREAVLAASVRAFPLPEKGRFVGFAFHRVRLVRDGAGEHGLVRVRG